MCCPAVLECLQEAGDDLFTFLRFPKAQWKRYAPRMRSSESTGNSVAYENTGLAANQDAVLLLLFGLLPSGQVKMRKIDWMQEVERARQAA